MKNRNVIQVETIFGAMRAFSDDFITNQLFTFGAHTRPELAFFLSVLKAGDAVFDLGAHIGTFTVPIAKKVTTLGRVLAVEAMTDHVDLLRDNLALNDVTTKVDVVQVIIGASNTTMSGVRNLANSGASYYELSKDSIDAMITTSIDQLVAKYFQPSFIKIDIEGWEAVALSSSSYVVDAKPTLYVEVADALLKRTGSSAIELVDWLARQGYRLFKNVMERNAPHDRYAAREFTPTQFDGGFCDILAIHERRKDLILAVDSSLSHVQLKPLG